MSKIELQVLLGQLSSSKRNMMIRARGYFALEIDII